MRVSQIRLKTTNTATLSKTPNPVKINRPKKEINLSGKTGGNGLDEYNLNVMNLE